MANIHVLSPETANLIAAGEVVERPLSVIKELVENSLDAGADSITVEIKNGGTRFIRITDNGCGMSKEDLSVCLLRHATSKISGPQDLDAITTLGFRGEALAATAAVSKYRIMTKRPEDETGYILTGEYGGDNDISEAGCPDGTTIIVEELFSNVPARRKFLKRDATEAAASLSSVEKTALSRPDVAFTFISDGELKLRTTGNGNLEDAVYSVLGRDFAQKTVGVDSEIEGIRVTGFTGTPENVKSNRNHEIFFINGRYIKSQVASAALEQAYKSYIPEDKFPVCVLDIHIHPTLVDVNVHPTKMEVKFSDSRPVFNAVYGSVRNLLLGGLDRPGISEGAGGEPERRAGAYAHSFVPVTDRGEKPSGDTGGYVMQSGESEDKAHFLDRSFDSGYTYGKSYAESTGFSLQHIEETPSEPERAPEVTEEKEDACPFFRVVGELFHAFIIVELENKILAIDKHAAHERILFEQMRENAAKESPDEQILLIPLDIVLNPEERAAVAEYSEEITALGFSFTESENGITLTSSPAALTSAASSSLIQEIAGALSSGTGNAQTTGKDFYEKALFTASCKAATKAGWVDSDEEIKTICREVITNPRVRFCPHGRPVAFEITRSEIERRFERS